MLAIAWFAIAAISAGRSALDLMRANPQGYILDRVVTCLAPIVGDLVH
jgi:hypothetical protein